MRASVVLLVAFLGCSDGQDGPREKPSTRTDEQPESVQARDAPAPQLEERTCVRVIDGDTIELDGGEKVRYVGIDAPETEHPGKPAQWMGKEAAAANQVLVEGREVQLEYDVERKDEHGCTLAYVWAGDLMVNERLVRMGCAQVSTLPPNMKYVQRFQQAQREAREAGRGLWSEQPAGLSRDDYNLEVLAQANKLVNQGRYDEAEKYLRQFGDPDGSGYADIEKRIRQIRAIQDSYHRNVKEREALELVAKLARRIKAYHAGKDVQPEQILELVEQLEAEYAGTETAAEARKLWQSWFAGRVPRRAVDLLPTGDRKRKDWEEVVERANALCKKWRFREARETIERYLIARKPFFDDEDLAHYKELCDQQVEIIDRLAASVYEGRSSAARRLVENKRFDAAIQVYQEIVDKFGIDSYVRKAQAEIEKIAAQR